MKPQERRSSVLGYTFGPFRLDLSRHQLLRGDEPVPLTAKAYETLVFLVRGRGGVLEKDAILSTVWPDAFVSEDSLTQAISMLRKAMGDDSSQPSYIATIPRRGYRFVAEAEEIPADRVADQPETPEPERREPAPAHTVTLKGSADTGRRWSALWWAIPAAIGLALVARTVSVAPRGVPTGAPVRFLQTAPAGTTLASGGTLSPDGRYLAFLAQNSTDGRTYLWIRPLDLPAPRLIAGTEGAYKPFWSPDSQSLGFFSDGKLKRVGVAGVPPQTLAAVGYRPSGGAWSSRGVIIYADRLSQMFSVPESGGEATPVTVLDAAVAEIGHHSPQFLPDGDHFLFSATSSNPAHNATYVGSLTSSDRIRLLDASAANALFAPPGYLLFVRDKVLMAQRFDPNALRVTGTATSVPAANAAQEDGQARVGELSASTNGVLTFGGDRPQNHLTWFSRRGDQLDTVPSPPDLHNPVLSPDGRFLVAEGGPQVWLVDLQRGAQTPLVENGNLAAWSHDGARISFTARRVPGTSDIYLRTIAGSDDAETLLVRSNEMKISGNWTTDGEYFTYVASNPQTRLDLWLLRGADKATPQPFLRTAFNEMQPQISPDGRWLAYASDESGAWEVYVQTFPAGGQKRTISVGGGAQPEWRRDGRELYYLSPDGTLMVVDVRSGTAFEAGRPRPLFRVPISADLISYRNQYAVTSDGQRFVIDLAADRDPINVVVNWNALVNP